MLFVALQHDLDALLGHAITDRRVEDLLLDSLVNR